MNDLIKIKRNQDDGKETQGKLDVASIASPNVNVFECVTLERPWLNNQNQVSCYPKGTYTWVKVPASSHIPYSHIAVENVENRAGICIHIFNEYFQSLGCTGVGSAYADINGDKEPDLLNSKITFEKLMSILPDRGTLIVS